MRLVLVFSLLTLGAIARSRDTTPLDEYVWWPDDSYRWELIQTQRGEECTFYTLFLISQTWYPGIQINHVMNNNSLSSSIRAFITPFPRIQIYAYFALDNIIILFLGGKLIVIMETYSLTDICCH